MLDARLRLIGGHVWNYVWKGFVEVYWKVYRCCGGAREAVNSLQEFDKVVHVPLKKLSFTEMTRALKILVIQHLLIFL